MAPRLPSVDFQQRRLNWWTNKYLGGTTPLIVDGESGPATETRIHLVRFYLGEGAARKRTWTTELKHRTEHPNDRRYTARERARGARRRIAQRARWRKLQARALVTKGVTRYDGIPVAAWLVPYLSYARKHGWQGRLNSGWRSPSYSRSLCYAMCGAPSCAGRCAGVASNHAGSEKPRGALDVSSYAEFGRLMERCPLSPNIFNGLGARDLVHYSASGRAFIPLPALALAGELLRWLG